MTAPTSWSKRTLQFATAYPSTVDDQAARRRTGVAAFAQGGGEFCRFGTLECAIVTGEAGVHGRQIGSIQIAERFSLVEVADPVADMVMEALKGTTIKGKKATVRLDKGR